MTAMGWCLASLCALKVCLRSALLVMSALLVSCASPNYQYGNERAEYDREHGLHTQQQFILGKPHRFLDAADWIWPGSWLAKLFLWNRDIDSHTISPETIADMQRYLERNELHNVQVLVNAYSPGNQWRRLFNNKTVGAGWRYTLGVLSVAYYSALPGRFFGGDAYNPYTNTIYLYSDSPEIALHEGGHAKDTARRQRRGLHAALYALPGAALYYEACATNDALSYLLDNELTSEQKEAYKTLHPAYGTYVLGTVGNFVSDIPGLSLLGAIPGHVTGGISALRVSEPPELADPKSNAVQHSGKDANSSAVP